MAADRPAVSMSHRLLTLGRHGDPGWVAPAVRENRTTTCLYVCMPRMAMLTWLKRESSRRVWGHWSLISAQWLCRVEATPLTWLQGKLWNMQSIGGFLLPVVVISYHERMWCIYSTGEIADGNLRPASDCCLDRFKISSRVYVAVLVFGQVRSDVRAAGLASEYGLCELYREKIA